jgi:hypothetical protein
MELDADALRQVVELLAIAITADMPVTMRNRIADRLLELGEMHKERSASAGTHCIALGNLLRGLPPPRGH